MNPTGFDSTVLINFGEVGALDVLMAATSAPRLITVHVSREILRDPTQEAVAKAVETCDIEVVELAESELANWAVLTQRLGAGEASTIAAAIHRGWTIALDDRLGRTLAVAELGEARVTGTIGLLRLAVERAVLTHDDAQALLDAMIGAGFWSNITRISER